jgi:hypothetical protein
MTHYDEWGSAKVYRLAHPANVSITPLAQMRNWNQEKLMRSRFDPRFVQQSKLWLLLWEVSTPFDHGWEASPKSLP